MELRKLSDADLENSLATLVAKERSLLCVIILHVMEIERRKKYLNSYPNLFSYLRDKLNYSHGSAQRRLDAAALALEIPSLLHSVKSGELNLTQITCAQVAFRLAAKTKKSKISAEVKQKVLEQIKNKSIAETEVILYAALEIKPKSKVTLKRQADESVRIEMTLTREQFAKLERTKQLLSHSVPTGHLTDLLEYVCDRVIIQKDKTLPHASTRAKAELKSGIQKTSAGISVGKLKTQSATSHADSEIPNGKSIGATTGVSVAKVAGETSKTELETNRKILTGKVAEPKHSGRFFASTCRKAIKISIQRAVFARDKCCQHKNPATGKMCGSNWHLQLDHIQPVWAGGTNEEQNLRVLCGVHNRWRYRRQSRIL